MVLDDNERLRLLTAPGAAFPLRDRIVAGRSVAAFDRDPRTLRDAFAATAGYGDRLAVGYQDEYWTYDGLWAEMTRLAAALSTEFGIGQGDRVGIAMRNYPEFIFAFGATQLLGAVAVPYNAWLNGRELADLVTEAAPKVLLADSERIRLALEFGLAEGPGGTPLVGVRCPRLPAGVTDYAALTGPRPLSPAPVPEAAVTPDDVATILFTSGTTGRPKAARHTHLNHSASLLNKLIRAVGVEVPADGGPVVVSPAPPSVKLVTFPFFHIAGLNTLYNTLYAGQTLILMYKWDAAEAVRLVETERVNELSGPPFVVQTFLAAARESGRDLSSLRSLGMGGAAAPADVIGEARAVLGDGVIPRTGYGMTETTSGVVAISGADFVQRPASVGRPLPTAEVAIMDADGHFAPAGTEGEVVVRGPQVITGYAVPGLSGDGVRTDENFADGWFRTGDIGLIDADGFVYLRGRLKDIVIRGGENISCAEVEGVLGTHPAVVEAVALGAPHATLGEEIVAVAHVRPGAEITADDLRRYAAERLAPFKVPARIALIGTHLPRTASGKIVKRQLAEQLDIGWLLEAAPAT
jgi:acyl-CoA synthetase (AMP-forming)/AMP-acid ligase II